jgi:hypothetical protein
MTNMPTAHFDAPFPAPASLEPLPIDQFCFAMELAAAAGHFRVIPNPYTSSLANVEEQTFEGQGYVVAGNAFSRGIAAARDFFGGDLQLCWNFTIRAIALAQVLRLRTVVQALSIPNDPNAEMRLSWLTAAARAPLTRQGLFRARQFVEEVRTIEDGSNGSQEKEGTGDCGREKGVL